LPATEAAAAAAEEVQAFARVFGAIPDVVVPPTFVWGDVVEAAWARAGVGVVVSPGRRNERRNAAGEPVGGARAHYNGEKGPDGVTYAVRDCYFEPTLGHSHRRALADLAAKTALGRPALLEIHRMNFLGDPGSARQSIDEVTRLLDAALSAYPTLRFLSTSALARELRERSPLVESGIAARIHYALRRLARNARLVKLAWITGAILPTACTYIATRPRAFAAT
jgi:hypothetical protein